MRVNFYDIMLLWNYTHDNHWKRIGCLLKFFLFLLYWKSCQHQKYSISRAGSLCSDVPWKHSGHQSKQLNHKLTTSMLHVFIIGFKFLCDTIITFQKLISGVTFCRVSQQLRKKYIIQYSIILYYITQKINCAVN